MADAETVPPRAPKRWFRCIEYAAGLKVESPYGSELDALNAAAAHVCSGDGGHVKVGYYGFRSRVIVLTDAELRQALVRVTP